MSLATRSSTALFRAAHAAALSERLRHHDALLATGEPFRIVPAPLYDPLGGGCARRRRRWDTMRNACLRLLRAERNDEAVWAALWGKY